MHIQHLKKQQITLIYQENMQLSLAVQVELEWKLVRYREAGQKPDLALEAPGPEAVRFI